MEPDKKTTSRLRWLSYLLIVQPLASAASAPLLWFLQSGLLRSSAGLGGLWFCCLCICCVFRFALDDFDGGGAPGRFPHLPVKILAVGLPACFASLGVHAALSCLCAVYPVFFVGYECSAHCFCIAFLLADAFKKCFKARQNLFHIYRLIIDNLLS